MLRPCPSEKSSSDPVLVLDQVTRYHQDGPTTIAALEDVSFSVYPGEFVAVMGPSGSGKTTLLHISGTLDRPTKGTVTIAGKNTTKLSAAETAAIRRRDVGFIFQHYNLIDTLTTVENIALPLEFDGTSHKHARKVAEEALSHMGLEELADRFPSELSGGQRQRVAIARALVGTRRLILADEPTGALDTTTAEGIMAIIRDRVAEGAAAVVVTHEPRFASIADRVVYLRDGHMLSPDSSTLRRRATIAHGNADTPGKEQLP